MAILATYSFAFWLFAIVGFFYGLLNPYAPLDEAEDIFTAFAFVVVVPLLAIRIVRRLRDRGKSAWHALLFLIPFWFIVEWLKAIFVKGDEGENWYGAPPAKKSTRWRILAWGALVVSGILALGLLSWSDQTFANDLEVGQCFNSANLGEDINVVSCSGGWGYKVVDKISVNRSSYPGESYFSQICDTPADFVFFPTKESWKQGDRTVLCLRTR